MGVGFHVFFLENEERFEYTRICLCRLGIFFDFAKLKFYHYLRLQGIQFVSLRVVVRLFAPLSFFPSSFSLDPNHGFPLHSFAITDHLIRFRDRGFSSAEPKECS